MENERAVELKQHHSVFVWEHTVTDAMRKEECLCLNCNKMQRCSMAAILYNMCKLQDIAMMITRCKHWFAKEKNDG